MVEKILLGAVASGLAFLGVGVLCYRRRAAGCARHGRLAGVIALLVACVSFLGAGGLVAYAWLVVGPAGTDRSTAAATPSEDVAELVPNAPAGPADPDEEFRRLAIGTWTDNYQGKRTMTLREDGTAVMICELSGLSATLFAARLQFDMVWSVEDGRLKKQTVGGEPEGKVKLILNVMGDRVDEPILELDEDRLVLLDKDGTTKYNWARAR